MNTLRVFNHYMHVKYILLGVLQCALLTLSVGIAARLRFIGQDVPMTSEPSTLLPSAAVFTVVIMISMAAMGVYHPQRRDGHLQIVLRVLISFLFAGFALVLLFYLVPPLYLGRGLLAIALFIALISALAIQLLFYVVVDQRLPPWRVLFYGAGRDAAALLAYLRRRSDGRLFTLVGCVAAEGENPCVEDRRLRTLHGSLLAFAEAHRVNEIVVAMDDRRQGFPSDELMACRIAGINVIDTLTFYERQTGKIKTELLKPSWIIFSFGFRRNPMQDMIKRAMDLTAATLLLVLTSPVMLATAAAIKIEDGWRRPIFFVQRRTGYFGHGYEIYKFRSMRTDAEAAGVAQWASQDDPRVTRVGQIIRKYRIDELPQLINVLKGEMSMVGPRPERPEFVSDLTEKLPYYRVRECARPGITGWAQLGYPYGASEEDANGKLQLDLYYVKNRSTFLDLLILLGTIEVVLFRKGGR